MRLKEPGWERVKEKKTIKHASWYEGGLSLWDARTQTHTSLWCAEFKYSTVCVRVCVCVGGEDFTVI